MYEYLHHKPLVCHAKSDFGGILNMNFIQHKIQLPKPREISAMLIGHKSQLQTYFRHMYVSQSRANYLFIFLLVGWDLRHQVLRPLLAYCTAPDDR
jgi:hypothetical protein